MAALVGGPLSQRRRRGIMPRIARRGIEPSERLGRYRWWSSERSRGSWPADDWRCGTTGTRPLCSPSCTLPVRYADCAALRTLKRGRIEPRSAGTCAHARRMRVRELLPEVVPWVCPVRVIGAR